MKLKNDTRGVSEVIGAILVFGLVIALMAILQTQAIPAANEEVEFNHNQQVQGDLVGLQETSSAVAARGDSLSTKIQMGTTYPSRMLFFNPPSPAGEIRTVGDQPAEIQNVNATNQEVNQFYGGSLTGLDTKRVEYDPSYNEYKDAPVTVLEYGAVYRDFGERAVIDNPGRIISGNTVSLTFFTGNVSRVSGRSLSIEARPTSAPARTVSVEADDPTKNITLRLPTGLNASEWSRILEDEENVEGVRDVGSGMVAVDLNGTASYNLRMAQVGIGSSVDSPDPAYIAPKPDRTIQSDQANRLPVEIRDRFNNPVSGETIYVEVSSGQFQNGAQQIETTTTSDGSPAALYSTGQSGVVTINASYERKPWNPGFNTDNKEDISFKIAFNPKLDTIDPTIDSNSVSLDSYTVCGGSGTGLGLIDCTTTTLELYQVSSDYKFSDSGGSGLDYMRVRVNDSSGNTLAEFSQSLSGGSKEGAFLSPLFPEDLGTPDEIEIVVFDNAGNKVVERSTVSP